VGRDHVLARLILIAHLFAALCLSGCGGAGGPSTNGGGSPTPSFTGDWQITDPNLGGLLIAGAYLSENGTSVSGVLAYQSTCASSPAAIQTTPVLNGFLTSGGLAFSFTTPGGVGTVTGTLSSPPTSFGGSVSGFGCNQNVNSQTQSVTGTQVPSLAGNWAGIVTNGGVAPFQVSLFLTEGAVDSTGTPALTGTATITGTFPPNTTVETLPGNATGNQMGPFLAGPNGDAAITTANGTIMLSGWLQDSGGVAQPNVLLVTNFSFSGGTYNGASGWTGTLNRQ
jgi:hypothetical protein